MAQLFSNIQELCRQVSTCTVANCDAAYSTVIVVAAHVADVLGGLAVL